MVVRLVTTTSVKPVTVVRDTSPLFRPFDTRRNIHAAKRSGDLFLRPGFWLIRRKNRCRRFLHEQGEWRNEMQPLGAMNVEERRLESFKLQHKVFLHVLSFSM